MGITGRTPQQSVGPASEALAGYVQLASVAEALAGLNQTKAVTPEGLQGAIDVVGNQTVKAQYFATISAGTTTGTISKPAGGGADVAFVMDEWGTDADALLSTLENGKPTFSTPTTALGVAITTTFNTAGEFAFSGTPSPANDIALIYVYKCYLTNLDPDEVLFESELISHSHSLLSNLDADDHTQYHNDTRGDVRYYKKTELNSGTLGSSGSSLIGINTINGDVPNLQMFVDGTQSSQVYSGGVVTKNAALDGTIDISAMTGYIKREADNESMDMGSFQIAEAVGASLTAGINYICVDWNNDTPIFTYLTSLPNHSTVFPFAQVYKDANDHLHIIQGGHNFLGLPWKVFERFYNVEGLVRASGLLTSAGSTHTHIDVSAGIFYQGLARFNFAAFDGDLKHEVDRVASSSTIVLDSGYGDLTTTYIHGLEIYLDGSGEAGNNDAFHVQSSSYSGGETTITVEGTPLTISAGDTGHVHPHTFTYWHYRLFDTTWVEANQAGQHVAIHIDTAYYNDITDADNGDELKTYTAQRYGVAWVYASSGEDSRVHVLYGQGDYTAAQAAEAAAPSSVPDILGKMGFLIAKIVFQTGDATLNNNLIFYPWTSTIATTGAADHGGLAGLSDDDHPQYIKDSEFTADSEILVGTGAGAFQKESGATLRTSVGVGTGDSPAFTNVKLSGLADGKIPYHVDDATGLADGPTKTDVDDAVTKKHASGSDDQDLSGYYLIANIEDTPTEDEADKCPSSEWAFDHDANATAHHSNADDHANTLDHTEGDDQALGSLGTKDPAIDADKVIYRDSTAADALVTSTWSQIKAFLKTYFDTVYSLTTAIVLKADFAAKGDLLSASADDTPLILTVGANDKVLTADSGEATGLKWADSVGGMAWELISADDTAVTNEGYLINATGGAITLTLPATPSEGDQVGVVDAYNKATTNVITVARNGSNIEGAASDLIIDVDGAGMVLVYCDATRGWEIVSEVGNELGTEAYVKVSDVKAYNAGGGTFTQDAWRTRDINTEDSDASSICSIASNQITLEAGTYICSISAPGYNVAGHRIRLYNITATEIIISGPNAYTSATSNAETRAILAGKFTIAAQTIVEVQHYCKSTYATLGLGVYTNTSGYDSIYTVAEFWRL